MLFMKHLKTTLISVTYFFSLIPQWNSYNIILSFEQEKEGIVRQFYNHQSTARKIKEIFPPETSILSKI